MTDHVAPDDPVLLASVRLGEGLRLTAYPDPESPRGKQLALPPKHRAPGWATLSGSPWTIGFGHCGAEVHDGLHWTVEQAEAALRADLANACAALDHGEPWWRTLTAARQRVLVELCFNLGYGRLGGFHRMWNALEAGRWSEAAAEMLDSDWARQVGDRAHRLAQAMRAG